MYLLCGKHCAKIMQVCLKKHGAKKASPLHVTSKLFWYFDLCKKKKYYTLVWPNSFYDYLSYFLLCNKPS